MAWTRDNLNIQPDNVYPEDSNIEFLSGGFTVTGTSTGTSTGNVLSFDPNGNVGIGPVSDSNITIFDGEDSIVIGEEYLSEACSFKGECVCRKNMFYNIKICSGCTYHKKLDIPNIIKKSKLAKKIKSYC